MTDYGYSLGDTYTGARATPDLVGRDFELAEIYPAIEDTSHSYIIYITSDGGRGKTRLAGHILKHPPENARVIMAQGVVDLYHTPARTVDGLLKKIRDAFPKNFPHYDAKDQELNQRLAGYGSILPAQYEELRETFFTDWNVLAEQQRIVLALDTVEKLHRQEDLAAKALGLAEDRTVILEWLFGQFLSQAQNFVLILAGRPYLENFETELQAALTDTGRNDIEFKSIALSGFTEDAALAYLDAVVRTSEQGDENDQHVAAFVRDLPEDSRRVIFQCLRETESPVVAPILLALAIDYLAVTGALPEFGYSLEEACALTPEQREDIRQKLGADLVAAIMEKRRPADEIIKALGWLRKGGTVELLAAVAQMSQAEVAEMLKKVQDLSFIKQHDDNRYFLHDEMYDLIQRHALEHVSPQRREGIFQAICDYYKTQIEQAREAIAELYLDELEVPNPEQVAQARVQLEDALVEHLFYQLHWNALEGYQTYFRYAEEAVAERDQSLDEQLRSELMNFLAEHDLSGKAEQIDGLSRSELVIDATTRWVRKMVAQFRSEKALEFATIIREKRLLPEDDHLAMADLNNLEGIAHLFLGDYEEARCHLTRANTILGDTQVGKTELARLSAIKASNYNYLGYLYRVLGQFLAATAEYRRALPYWRYVKLEANQAGTLRNLAFALAFTGSFDEARRHAIDALSLEKKRGNLVRVALIYNVRATVELLGEHYLEAEYYAGQALAILQRLEQYIQHGASLLDLKRSKGLVLINLSDIHRHMSEDKDLDIAKKEEFLTMALIEAQSALEIFADAKEPERKIAALYRCGVAGRQQCRLIFDAADKTNCVNDSLDHLNEARELARSEKLWFLYYDVSLGLAWTYYYANEIQRLLVFINDLEAELRAQFSRYFIERGYYPKIEEDMIIGIFGQIARLYILLGVIAIDNENFELASHHFTLALEHDCLVAPDGHGISRALNTIHDRLRKLNYRELLIIYNAVINTAHELGITEQQCRMWHELENTYGPYEIFRLLSA